MIGDVVSRLPESWPELGGLITVLAYMVWRDRWRNDRDEQRDKAVDAKLSAAGSMLAEVHEQAVNSHGPDSNLRDDVDRTIGLGESSAASSAIALRLLDDFRSEARDTFKDIRRDIGGLRQDVRNMASDLSDERRERIAGDRRDDEHRRRGDPM